MVTRGIADTSVFIAAESGLRMPVNDSWIAATALSLDVAIVTQDDDYDVVPDLAIIKV